MCTPSNMPSATTLRSAVYFSSVMISMDLESAVVTREMLGALVRRKTLVLDKWGSKRIRVEDGVGIERVKVVACRELEEIVFEHGSASVDIRECSALRRVEFMKAVERTLTILESEMVGEFEFPRELQTLRIEQNREIKTMDLRGCTRLTKVVCVGVSGMGTLRVPRTLRQLELSECAELAEIEGLRETALDECQIRGSDRLERIEPARSVRRLRIERCHVLREIADLDELEQLTVDDASRLRKMVGTE